MVSKKGLQILYLLSEREEMTSTEIVRELEISFTTISRLRIELKTLGLIDAIKREKKPFLFRLNKKGLKETILNKLKEKNSFVYDFLSRKTEEEIYEYTRLALKIYSLFRSFPTDFEEFTRSIENFVLNLMLSKEKVNEIQKDLGKIILNI